jgi:hypothetical protein
MEIINRELSIMEIAAANAGYLTVGQAVATGFTRSEIRTRVRNGDWNRARSGLIRVPDLESDDIWRDRVHREIAAAGELAAGARYTAARWQHIVGAPTVAPIEIAVPRERHPAKRPGVKVVRTVFTDADLAHVGGIMVTSPLRTVVDCARYGDHVAAVCLIESAVRSGAVTLDEVTEAICRIKAQPYARRAERAVQRVDLRSESPLETRIRLLLLDDGLPYPELQLPFELGGIRGRIDLAYPLVGSSAYRGLAIEADGRDTHARAEAFHDDPIRQTALEEDRWLVRRFTDRHAHLPGYVTRTVRRALARLDHDRLVTDLRAK